MRKALLVIIVALVLVPSVSAENFGGVSARKAQRMENLVYQRFGWGWLGHCMVRIMYRESGANPRAANWSDRHSDGSRGSFGLFQIGAIHRGMVGGNVYRLFNPRTNVRVAWRLARGGRGLHHWGGCA